MDEFPRCPQCSYILLGLVEHRCPECGTPFDPAALVHTRLPSKAMRAWGWVCGVALVPLAAYAMMEAPNQCLRWTRVAHSWHGTAYPAIQSHSWNVQALQVIGGFWLARMGRNAGFSRALLRMGWIIPVVCWFFTFVFIEFGYRMFS